MDANDTDNTNRKSVRIRRFIIPLMILVVGCASIVLAGSLPPAGFPAGAIISIPKNSSLSGIADELAAQGIIKSAFMYKAYVVLARSDHRIQAGEYLFDAPQSALRVAYRTAYGIEGLSKIKVTVPEGSDSRDITRIMSANISGFASTTFLSLAKADEGYLFPDTYFFYMDTTPQQAIDEMRADFDERIAGIAAPIDAFIASSSMTSSSIGGQRTSTISRTDIISRADIITMASIVEKEATSTADRRVIAGILWKRLAAGIPLEVDPAPDTYRRVGLPPTPIDDPGLDAIIDTVTPTATPYWFYISDKDGVMHYAATLDGHNANIAKYLN